MIAFDSALPRQIGDLLNQQGAVSRKTCCFVALAVLVSGCSTANISYTPRPGKDVPQTLKYTDGVGTLSEKDETRELFVYSRFKMQGPTQPTFTIGYANNTAEPVNFSTDNIKAYFRGAPVQIYTYNERIAEIQSEKQAKQVALAIIGGLAAGAAAYGASRQTYRSNYSGSVVGRRGVTSFAGSNTVRVYDPVAGMLAGAAVGGATVLGIRQIEYNAENQEQSANSILQLNTVEPLQMVTGDLILKNCCDPQPQANDLIRLEVTASGKTSVFEFARTQVKSR
ncbi:hypothetical protein SAMN05518845_10679 [Variovorax sp. YR750]|uniref:hypothetical protein n=1 Tax=Variovorax sp. YR750 TaxID=1884384 RepID=UPI0008AFDC8F|nr:hypothetical protein [Variovorax sp. YR750]SEL30284.1 hypothetical protein SAMN05518845_10679 [Variovorax sp. YR750]